MAKKFPPPCDRAFMLIDGKAVPVESIPKEEWEEIKKKVAENIGRAMSAHLSRDA